MATVVSEGVSEAGREAYIKELFKKATTGQDGASFIELGQIAAGRNDLPLAKELFLKLENKEEVKING